MGSGAWSTDVYAAAASTRAATGTSAFDYSERLIASTPRESWAVHDDLDPKRVNGPTSPLAGQNVRESRDNDEHPLSVPVAVLFDVTGSMANIPVELQKRLPTLLELLQYKQYVPDPQILFGAVGDAAFDQVPLQIGQFESDNRMEDCLGNIVLERGGGYYGSESYELALYFMARHTATDSWEKRQKKGYFFLIGDEAPYPAVKPAEVAAVIGDDIGQPIAFDDVLAEVRERWEVFFIVPGGHDAYAEWWTEKLGQNCLRVPDLSSVAETIALQIGVMEQTIELEQGLVDLREKGTSDTTIQAVSAALTT